MTSTLLPCPICYGQATLTSKLAVSDKHVIEPYDEVTIRCPTCTIILVRDNYLSNFSKDQVTSLAINAWNLLKRVPQPPIKLVKHVVSGNVYKHLGIINHKDEVTRKWVKHIVYEGDEIGVKYSRTVEDFHNTFEEFKL